MSRRVAASAIAGIILAGCTLLTDLEGFDNGSSPRGVDSGPHGTAPNGTLLDGNASSSSTTSSSTSSTSSSTSTSSSGGPDASPDGPPVTGGCTITTSAALTPSVTGTTGSGPDWTAADNAMSEDGLSATVALTGADDESRYLLLSSFNANIPATAEIRGVTVSIRAKATASSGAKDVRDEIIRLAPNASLAGSTMVGMQGEWGAAFSVHTAGGPTNLWGLTLTPAIVNAPAFGLGYVTRYHASTATQTGSLDVDVVKVTITYCN